MRQLDVYVDTSRIGQLREGDDLWRFQYDRTWVNSPDGFDLSPSMPRQISEYMDGGSSRPVQWFFDNLLPEELLRQALLKEALIKGDDAFALLQYLGAESAGSLTLIPPGHMVPTLGSLRVLPDEHLSVRIANLPGTTLTAGAPKRMSLAGAQHKLLVISHRGDLYEPEGATPSTHILKPNHPDADAYPASVVNEYLTMRLAKAAGLSIPAVEMRYLPQPVYLIQRFDRTVVGSESDGDALSLRVYRKHVIDACQLLNRSRLFKHAGASVDALKDLVLASTNKANTRLTLFRWLVFNVLVGNDDCHLKNLSFFVSPEGVQIAPHYDLLCTAAYYTRAFANERAIWPDVRMAIPLGAVIYFRDVSPQCLVDAGSLLGVPDRVARRIIHEVVSRVNRALDREIAAIRTLHQQAPESARVFVGAEERFLRVFEHIVLKEMLARLR